MSSLNVTTNVCVPPGCEFQLLKLFYPFKQTNKRDRQSLRRFPGPEITWIHAKEMEMRKEGRKMKAMGKARERKGNTVFCC